MGNKFLIWEKFGTSQMRTRSEAECSRSDSGSICSDTPGLMRVRLLSGYQNSVMPMQLPAIVCL